MERLEGRLLRSKAHGEARGGCASGGSPAVRGLACREDTAHVTVAESLERAGDLSHADEVDADAEPAGLGPHFAAHARLRRMVEQRDCQIACRLCFMPRGAAK